MSARYPRSLPAGAGQAVATAAAGGSDFLTPDSISVCQPEMYGNAPVESGPAPAELSREERRSLRRDLASVAAETRDLLPAEFVVGSEITAGTDGPRAMVAVQPPVGSMVSADYEPDLESDVSIADDERADIAKGLAASAALQVKRAFPDQQLPAQ